LRVIEPECTGTTCRASDDVWISLVKQPYLRTQHLNTEDVQTLATNVLGTHVDDTLHAELGTHGSGSDAVLSCTCFGNDPLLS
jgi:hypothetical protein